MARGHPDWGAMAAVETVAPIADLSEAVVRLGSIDRFDRRGNVFYLEDFQNGRQHWLDASSGTGSGSALSVVRTRSGSYSLALTAGSAGAKQGGAFHNEPYPVLSRFGFECSVSFVDVIDRVEGWFVIFDGATVHHFRWRYSYVSGAVQYLGPGATWDTLASPVNLHYGETLFHTFKLVVNLTTQRYVRLIVNRVSYDMANLEPYSLASTAVVQVELSLLVYGPGGNNPTAWFDDVILTQNEP